MERGRKIGAVSQISEHRNKDLMAAWKDALNHYMHLPDEFSQLDVITYTLEHGASRYWISSEAVYKVICTHLTHKTEPVVGKSRYSQMIRILYDDYISYHKEHPNICMRDSVDYLVNRPAPFFPLSESMALQIIIKEKRKWFEIQKKRLRFMF